MRTPCTWSFALWLCACCPSASSPAPPATETEPPPPSPLPPDPPPISGAPLGPDGLPTPAALAHAVFDFNEWCGDTFCEGSFDWTFDSLVCRTTGCTLSFHARYYAAGSPVIADRVEVRRVEPMIETHSLPNGHMRVLASDALWAAVNEAIVPWERAHEPPR